MSTLISDIVDPVTLKKLDRFDLAFLAATGHLAKGDSFDAAFVMWKYVMKDARDVELWGPEAKLLGSILGSFWREKAETLIPIIKNAFNLIPEAVSVNKREILSALEKFQEEWEEAVPDLTQRADIILAQTIERSRQFHEVNSVTAKADVSQPLMDEWMKFLAEVSSKHLEAFVASFPHRTLQPEIIRLVELAENNPNMRSVDVAVLGQRLDNLTHFMQDYLDTLSDVQTGRAWTWTGIEWGFRNGFSIYMVIAELDGATCEVCRMIHGKEFAVEDARQKISTAAGMRNATEVVEFMPFPRHKDLDNKSPSQWKGMALTPPFHNRCRCQVVMTGVAEAQAVQLGEVSKEEVLRVLDAHPEFFPQWDGEWTKEMHSLATEMTPKLEQWYEELLTKKYGEDIAKEYIDFRNTFYRRWCRDSNSQVADFAKVWAERAGRSGQTVFAKPNLSQQPLFIDSKEELQKELRKTLQELERTIIAQTRGKLNLETFFANEVNITHAVLEKILGSNELTVYRGVGTNFFLSRGMQIPRNIVPDMHVYMNSLSSWSLSEEVARAYAGEGGFVLKYRVRARDFFSGPLTDRRLISDTECIIFGKKSWMSAYRVL